MTRSYGLECFWHSLVACWLSVALLHDVFTFVAFTIVCEHDGQIPFQRYVALVFAEAMCLRCVCIVLEALLAWRGVAF